MNSTISESHNVRRRRENLEKEINIKLPNISSFSEDPEAIVNHNCENMIGCTEIPIGVAGPILVNGKKHYLPLAGTEGALVASVSRGCKISREINGINAIVENVGITRGPVFKTKGITESFEFVKWLSENINKIKLTAESTSRHLKLLNIENQIVGKNVFLRFIFDSGDAMGMNMATIATSNVASLIEKEYKKAKLIALSGNFCIDKKASWLNFVKGRGKKVWADAIISKEIIKKILHTAPANIAEVCYRKNLIGSAVSGSLGFNAHFANVVAALYLATGQDAAHIVEGSLGITTAELEENGDLYFSVFLPDIVCGVVGGGTGLKTQKEALEIMNVKTGNEFAEVLGAAVLAGELSLLGSLAEGSLAKAHNKLGRSKK